MSKCRICGRPLTNAASVAAGVGPICGARNYRGRIKARFGSGLGGWSEIEEWEKVNSPCYSCKQFSFPAKDEEQPLNDGYIISMRGQELQLPKNSIGGWCGPLRMIVDGNLIKSECMCKGQWFKPRKTEDEQPAVGLLFDRNGQAELFEI